MKLILIILSVFFLPFSAPCQSELTHDTNTTFVEWKNKRRASKSSLDRDRTDSEISSKIRLYPNPSYGQLKLEFGDFNGFFSLEVHDLKGKLIRRESLNGKSQQSFDFSGLETGIYLLSVVGHQARNPKTHHSLI